MGMRLTAFVFIVAFLAAGLSRAGAQPDRPESSRRVVRTWNFDDAMSRVEPVPVGWFRAQDNPPERDRPGFPAWNIGRIAHGIARSGERSVMLPTKGGNTSMMLSAGAVPALPQADYAVRAFVRTDGLAFSRAGVAAWLLDENLRPIAGTSGRSDLVNTGGQWSEVTAHLRGHDQAAWLQIELLCLQPREFEAARSIHQVWPEDYSGAAYFDDVQVSQVPRVELIASAPANIFVGSEAPEVLLSVRDLTGEPLSVELVVLDLDGALVTRESIPAPEAGRLAAWRPGLPRFGWYSIRMTVSSEEEIVGERRMNLIWAPEVPAPDMKDRQSFGVVGESLSPTQRAALPEFLSRILAGSASLAVFTPGSSDDPPGAGIDPLSSDAERLLSQGADLTFVLTNLPRALTRDLRIDPDDPIPLLLAPDDPWIPYTSRTLSIFGERIRRWQLGPTGGEASARRANLPADIEVIRRKLRTQIPRPVLAVPWGLHTEPGAAAASADSLTIHWPVGVPASEIERGFGASFGGTSGIERTLWIDLPGARTFGARAAAVELARRASAAWAAGARRLTIDRAWEVFSDAPERLQPTPEAAIWRSLCAVLASSSIVGRLPVADGVTVYMVEPGAGGRGALIGWNDGADPEAAVIEGWLGDGIVTALDPFGNQRRIEWSEGSGHVVQLQEMPTIVSGVDIPLARFRAAARIEPPFLAARAERHQVEVVIENPWPVGITGRLRIAEPVEWTISPRVIPFVLTPGETARVSVEIAFAPGQEAGRQNLIAEVDLTAERRYPVMRWPMALDLGLPTVDLLPSYRIEPSPRSEGTDLVVSLLITNLSESPLTIEAFAQAPGYRAFEAPVSALEPGASVTRRFRFDGGGERLKGRMIRVGLKETTGTGRLNRSLHVE